MKKKKKNCWQTTGSIRRGGHKKNKRKKYREEEKEKKGKGKNALEDYRFGSLHFARVARVEDFAPDVDFIGIGHPAIRLSERLDIN